LSGSLLCFWSLAFLSTLGIAWQILVPVAGLLMMAIAYFRNAVKNPTVMIINKNGFYYLGQLITNWENFIDVQFIDDMPQPGIYYKVADRFAMMIRITKVVRTDIMEERSALQIPKTNLKKKLLLLQHSIMLII